MPGSLTGTSTNDRRTLHRTLGVKHSLTTRVPNPRDDQSRGFLIGPRGLLPTANARNGRRFLMCRQRRGPGSTALEAVGDGEGQDNVSVEKKVNSHGPVGVAERKICHRLPRRKSGVGAAPNQAVHLVEGKPGSMNGGGVGCAFLTRWGRHVFGELGVAAATHPLPGNSTFGNGTPHDFRFSLLPGWGKSTMRRIPSHFVSFGEKAHALSRIRHAVDWPAQGWG
jgi:hypothetical protein